MSTSHTVMSFYYSGLLPLHLQVLPTTGGCLLQPQLCNSAMQPGKMEVQKINPYLTTSLCMGKRRWSL